VRTEHKSGGKTVWVDLCEPTEDERQKACDDFGLDIPPRSELEEIEFSSRLQYEDGIFTISVPVTPHIKDGDDVTSPLGFMLTKDLLVTIRFAQLQTFPGIIKRVERRPRAAPDIFMVIQEALVDYSADRLEELRAEALTISNRIFHKQLPRKRQRNVTKTDRMLRETLVDIGDMGERLSHIRDTLLVLQRVAPFVAEHGNGWLEDVVKARLKMVSSDVLSLNDYEVHLTDKIQFLLDAALGFINTEQNNLFRVLTIASVVGIPPTFVVGLYGMNFHNMPELSWAWGYQWGLFLVLLSTVLPIAWFKWKGWW
jgi:magnesium transporter